MPLSVSVERHSVRRSLSLTPLPLLERLLQCSKCPSFLSNTLIVYIHHPLKTSLHLIDSLCRLGAKAYNIFALGKKYSECEDVVQKIKSYGVYYQPCSKQLGLGQYTYSFIRDVTLLWERVIQHLKKETQRILILDHGAYAIRFIPRCVVEKYTVIGVEKTTAGLIKLHEQGWPPFPLISVADCAAKKIVESPLIAKAITEKLLSLLPRENKKIRCGIIGYGSIGKALATQLLSLYPVTVYDLNISHSSHNGIQWSDRVETLIENSDYIFGCTGRECIESIEPFYQAKDNKTVISCSSDDIEFLPLLKMLQRKKKTLVLNPLADIQFYSHKGALVRLLKGGFPVNFDHSGESVPSRDIQLTRALVLGAILQSGEFFNRSYLLNKAGIYTLDPKLQQFIVNEWQKGYSSSKDVNTVKNFQNLEWIVRNSGGIYENCSIIKK